MKIDPTTRTNRLLSKALMFLLFVVSVVVLPDRAVGQTKILATHETQGTSGVRLAGPIIGSGTNVNGDNDNFARINASPGLIVGAASYSGFIQVQFPSPLVAEQWSYIRLNADQTLLGALLGGSLGGALSTVLNAVLFGNQEIEVQARSGNNPVLTRTSTQGFDTDRVRLVTGSDGHFYLAVKPDSGYDRIRITNRSSAVAGLLSNYVLDIYNVFTYESSTGFCGHPTFTSFDGGNGLSLSVAEVNNQNLGRAIDNDPTTYSQLASSSLLALDVGRQLSQFFYFPTRSSANHTFNVSLSLPANALNVSLLGGVRVIAWDGNQQVYTQTLGEGLLFGTDALGLLQNGQAVTFPFGPGRAFDRVEVRLNSLVGLSLANTSVRIHDVQRYDGVSCVNPALEVPEPTDPMLSNSDCAANVVEFGHANFPYHATDGNNDTYTTLQASSGVAVGVGAYQGFIELGFGQRTAGTTTYVRIDFEEEVLLGLLNGSVGQLLGGIVDNVLFGEHFFTVEAKQDANVVLGRSSNVGFSGTAGGAVGTGTARIVQDKNGHFYVAITPTANYNRLRITERLGALLGLGEVRNMNVYHACESTGSELCEQAFSTFSESEGINLDLLGVGGFGVQDAQFAIDDDPDTRSSINVGAVGVGAGVFQHVQFHTLSDVRDYVALTFSVNSGSLVDLDLLSTIEIRGYNGTNQVFSQRLTEDVIGLDLLGLLQSGQPVTVRVAAGVAFDRIAIGKSVLVAANILSSPLHIYDVKRYGPDCPEPGFDIPDPTDTPFNIPACATQLVSFDGANFPFHVTDSNNETFATLTSGTGLVAGLGGYNSHIELGYGAEVPANTTSYIRINAEEQLLQSLLGGTLGNALGDLLGSVLLGNHYFEVEIKNGSGAVVGSGSSANQFDDQFVKLVQDAEGRFYIAVTASVPYQSVRITHELSSAVGLGRVASMDVYNMCHETAPEFCDQARFVSFDGSGLTLSLDVTNLTAGGVNNPQYVIDENTSNYSTISLGTVGVGATVYQNIYFNGPSQATDRLRLRVQTNQPNLLNAEIISSYRIILYNGGTEVYNEALSDAALINVNLLPLLNSGGIQELTVEPGVVFDRVQFGLQAVAAIGTAAPLRLYEVSRISDGCPDPTFEEPPFVDPLCATELIEASNADNIENLFNGNNNSFATIRSNAGIVAGLFGNNGFVELGYGTTNVAAGTTSYIRIDADATLLQTLLSGSLGNALSQIVGNVVLGHHYFTVNVKDEDGQSIVSGSSSNGFAQSNGAIRIVQDQEGRFYLAITPSADYNRIRITDFTTSVAGLGNENSINVYGLCHETNFDGCAFPFATSFDGSGLSVDLTGIGGYGVTNAYRAIDPNNTTDYSEISLGTLNVAGTVVQRIQFNKSIEANTVVNLDMMVGTGALTADIFGRIEIVGYNNGQQVYAEALQSAVIGNLNLAQLFNNGARNEVAIAVDEEIDEIGVRLRSLASVTAVPNVRLYNVEVDCTVPQYVAWKSFEINDDPALTSVSGGETVEYTIHVRNTGAVPLEDLIVTDAIPANTTLVAGSISGGGVDASGTITWNGVDVPVGATTTLTFSVTINPNLTGVSAISNVALVQLDAADPGKETFPPVIGNPTEPDQSGDTGTDIPVVANSDLISWKAYAITNGASSTSVSGGETITYNIFVRNTGNQDLTNIVISDVLPNGTIYGSGGTLTGNTVSFTIPTLAVGATSTAQEFIVTVIDDLTGISVIRNIATVVSDEITTPEESFPPVNNDNPTEPDDTGDTGTDIPVDLIQPVLAVTEDGAVANGIDENVLTATVVTTNGALIANEEVVFNITYPDGTSATETLQTDANGQAVLNIVSTRAGTATIEALVRGSEIANSPVTVNFIAGPADPTESTLEVTKNGAIADGTDFNEVTATIVDANGNPIVGQNVVFDIVYPNGATEQRTVATNAQGQAVVQVTSAVIGSGTITAQVAGQGITGSPATVIFVADNIDLVNSQLTIVTNNAIANGVAVNQLLATIVDGTNNPIAGVGVYFQITYPDGSTENRSVMTGGDGLANLNISSTVAGIATVVATVGGDEINGSPAMVTFVAGPVDPAVSILEITKNNAVANGIDNNIVQATITDANGNPISGVAVEFVITNPDLSTRSVTITTGVDGIAILDDIISTVAGSASVTATVGGDEISGSPATLTFVAGPIDLGESNLAVTEDGATADGTDFNEFTATVTDADGNPIAGVAVDFAITNPDGTTRNETVTTGANGQAVIQVTSLVPGEVSVTAGIGGSSIAGSPATATFVACIPTPTITPDGSTTICEGTGVSLLAASAGAVSYQWYVDGNIITGATDATYVAMDAGVYTVIAFGAAGCQSTLSDAVTVTVNPVPEITITGETSFVVAVGGTFTLPTVTTTPVGLPVVWTDAAGDPVAGPSVGPLTIPGTYIYTATTVDNGCTASASISVLVFDPEDCPPGYERVYATSASTSSSGVTNPELAYDGDLESASAINLPTVGIGWSRYQQLNFGESFDATQGDELHVKLSSNVALGLLPVNVSLQAYNGSTPVGTAVEMSSGLLNLLAGQAERDIVIPNPGNDFNSVRVTLSGAVSVSAGALNIFEGYVNRPVQTLAACNELEDILIGTTSGLLGTLNGVTNKEAIANDDMTSFATISQNVNALGAVYLTAIYPSLAQQGDSVRVILRNPGGGLLDAGVLTGISINAYHGNTLVQQQSVGASLLTVRLLPGSSDLNIVSYPINAPFDRVEVSAGGTVGALQSLDVARVERIAAITIGDQPIPEVVTVCQGASITLDTDDCGTKYEWYDESGDLIVTGLTFTVPATQPVGSFVVYVQPKRFGCDFGGRIPVTINVQESPTAEDITIAADQDAYCLGDGVLLIATADVSFTDPQFTWYFDNAKTQPVVAGEVDGVTYTIDNGELTISGLESGDYTYFVSVRDGAAGCENAAGDLASVTVTVNPRATEDDITATDATICMDESIDLTTLVSSATVTSPVFRFYTDADLTTEVTDPTVSPMATTTYYVTVSGTGICDNAADDAATVTVTVNPRATAADIIATDATICMDESIDLTTLVSSATVTSPVFRFYTDADLTTEVTDPTVSPMATTTYYVTVSGTGICDNAADDAATVTVTVNPRATAADIADIMVNGIDPDGNVCMDENGEVTLVATLDADSDIVDPVFHWYDGDGNTVSGGADGMLVLSTLAPGTYTYSVGVSGTGICETAEADRTSVTFTAGLCTDLSIEKTVDNIAPRVGTNVVFTVVATNNGPSDATGVTVIDELPTGYDYVSSTVSTGIFDPATNTWTIGDLANGASATMTITAQVLAAGDYINFASVTGGQEDPDDDNNEDTPDDPVVPVPVSDLSIEKTVDNIAPRVGTNVVFTVVATNNGPSDATGVTVIDELPTGYDYVSSTTTVGTFDPTTNTWTIGDLANGSSATMTITAQVLAAGDYINFASVTGGQEDPDDDNNEDTPDDPVVPVPVSDLSIEKTVDNIAPRVGTNVVFTVVATNNGPSDATGVTVIDELPTGYDYVSSTTTVGTFDPTTNTWTIGDLANGASATMTITAQVLAAGDYINFASVTGGQEDPDDDNNEDTPDDPVVPVPVSDLSIEKTVDNIAPRVGTNVIFTVVATNNGPSDATGVTVIDELPTGYDYVSSTVSTGTFDPATNTWTIGDLANGASATMTITAQVLAAGDYINFASVTGDQEDPDDDNNDDTPDDPVVPVPVSDLSIEKTVDNIAPRVGTNVVFTVVATNNGPSDATGVTVIDELPTGYDYVSSTTTVGTFDPATNTWTIGDLANGASATMTITAQVLAAGDYINFASVTGGQEDPDDDNNEDTPDDPVVPVPVSDLSIEKTVDNIAPRVGTNVIFTVVATNNGPSDATGVTVIDELPTGYDYVSSTTTVGTFDPTTNTWTIGDLANGASATMTITAQVLAAGDYINFASVTGGQEDPDDDNNEDTPDDPVVPVPVSDLSIEKTVDNIAPRVGTNVIFTVVATNNGPSDATGVTVTDELPTGYDYVSSTVSTGIFDPATNTWTIGDLANGASATMTITAQVLAAGDYINFASVTGGQEDPDDDNNEDTPDDPVVPVPVSDLSIEKTVDNIAPRVGTNVIFTVVATNNGPSDATGVTVIDELPTGYDYVSSTVSTGTFDPATNTWTIGDLANGASATMTITAQVLAAGDYINFASVTGDQEDPDDDNNEDTPDDPVVPVLVSDLSIEKTVDNIAPRVGTNVIFTVVATNNGPSDATGVTVIDELPTGYDYVSSTVSTGTFDPTTNTWTIGDLANGASATMTITAEVLAAGDYINFASVTGDQEDPDDDNNEDTPDDPVVPVPVSDLSIEKTVDNIAPRVGTNVVFTVVATNNGPSDATGVTVTDELPTGYDYVSSTVSTGTFDPATNTWTIGDLANGASATMTITAQVLAAGDYINFASVTGDQEDPDDDNNEDTPDDPVVPVPAYDISITKVADEARVVAGEETTFTLTITNNGPSTLPAGETLSLRELPGTGITIQGYTMISTNAEVIGTGNSATVTTGVAIPTQGQIQVRVTALVDADAPTTITNGIRVWGPEKDPETEDPDDQDETPEVPVDREYTLSITKEADQERVIAGESTTFTLTITNNGPSAIETGKVIRLLELPGDGVTVTDYSAVSNNASVVGDENEAEVTTTEVIAPNATIIIQVDAEIALDANETITNGIRVWGPDKDPETENPDDEDETPEIPVDYIAIQAVDDRAATTLNLQVTISNLENDIAGQSEIDRATIEIVDQPMNGRVEVTVSGETIYIPNTGYLGTDRYTYRVQDLNGRWSNIAAVSVEVMANDLQIPNVITPNGDGVNDQFVIVGREAYDRVELTILNRFGNEVYRNDDYRDEWDGVGLHDGTYYYFVRLYRASGVEDRKGNVLIKRN